MSDLNGAFTLSGAPAGEQVLDIDSGGAQPAPNGAPYASFREKLTLISAVTNQLERPIFLPRIDPAGTVQVVAGQATVVANPNLGITLTVAADTAFLDGAPFLGELSISEVPLEFAPMALPEELGFAQLITIQPTGVTFSQPAPITFPNLDGMPPGSEVDIYSLDPATGTFTITGVGRVSADGTVIETISGGVTSASWHGLLGPLLDLLSNLFGNSANDQGAGGGEAGNASGGASSGGAGDPSKENNPTSCDKNTNSSAAACSGGLSVAHATASHRSLGESRTLAFVYNSTGADPRPVVPADATVSVRSAVPNTISARLSVAGIAQGSEVFTSTAGLSESLDETLLQAVQFDAAEFATGSYPYALTVTSNFNIFSVGAVQSGQVLVNNERASPFGAGWTLSGLQRLRLQNNDARAVLTRGDGSTLVFRSTSALDVSGSLAQVGAPASVEAQAEESDLVIRVFEEADERTLSASVDLDDITPAGAVLPTPWADLPAGAMVNSHLIHFDPLGQPSTAVVLGGTVIFPSDILGVIFNGALLDASDGALGAAGTLYPLGAADRGLDGDTIALGLDRRTLTVTLSATTGIDQIRVITARNTEPAAESRFDIDAEGWTMFADANGPFYQATGGNPGGHLRAVDQGTGAIWAWSAPAKFLGGQSAAYGGTLAFDLRQASTSRQLNLTDITLVGAGLALIYNTPYNPGTGWTHYATLLHEAAGWSVSGQGRAPSAAEMQAVLAALSDTFDAVGNRTQLADDAGLSGEPGSRLSMDAGARNQLYPLFRWRDCGPMHRGT